MDEARLPERIVVNPKTLGEKSLIRGRRLAVEHVLGMLTAGDSTDTILSGYPWRQREHIQACLLYTYRVVGNERVELAFVDPRE